MTHIIELPDTIYQALEQVAQRRGQTPERLLETLIAEEEARESQENPQVYHDLDEFFRSLGASEEDLRESERLFLEYQQRNEGETNSSEGKTDADL